MNWVSDAWFLLREHHEFDWTVLVAVATDGRLALPLAVTLSYLADSLAAPVPTSTPGTLAPAEPVEDQLRALGIANDLGHDLGAREQRLPHLEFLVSLDGQHLGQLEGVSRDQIPTVEEQGLALLDSILPAAVADDGDHLDSRLPRRQAVNYFPRVY